jgi:hypothetical protein
MVPIRWGDGSGPVLSRWGGVESGSTVHPAETAANCPKYLGGHFIAERVRATPAAMSGGGDWSPVEEDSGGLIGVVVGRRSEVKGPLAAYRASDILTAVTKMRMTGPGPVPCTGAPFPRDK